MKANESAKQGRIWTLGKPEHETCLWAAGPGTPQFFHFADSEAIAVIVVEWRRPKAEDEDDDVATVGYLLRAREESVRVSAHASVNETANGLTLAEFVGAELPIYLRDLINRDRSWGDTGQW